MAYPLVYVISFLYLCTAFWSWYNHPRRKPLLPFRRKDAPGY